MSSSALSLQERIQRTRRHRRGPSPVTTTTSSPEEERTGTSSPEVPVQKEQLTRGGRGGSYRAATATLSMASSSALSTENQDEKRSSPLRKGETLAQRRERVLRRKEAHHNPGERKGDDNAAEKSPLTKGKAEAFSQMSSAEANPPTTPETISKIQARWPPSPALKAFLDDHEQQTSSRSPPKASSSGKRESQSKIRHENEKSPSTIRSANKPVELRSPFFRTSPPVASTTSPATVKKTPWMRPGATDKAPVETTESPAASQTSPAVKPSWVRQVANDQAAAAATTTTTTTTQPAWLSTSPVASTTLPTAKQQKPSWVRPTTNEEAEPPEETREPAWLPKSPASSTASSGAKQPSWVRSVASKAAESAAMESVASPKTPSWARPTGKEQTTESPAPNAADASSSKTASWAQPSSRGRAPASTPTPIEAISSAQNAAENPKKSFWTRPTARAPPPASTDSTTATTTSKVPNTENVVIPKKAFWSRPTARPPSPALVTATATSEVPNTEDVTSPKGALWSRPTPRAPSPAAATAFSEALSLNTEDVASPRNSPEALPTGRAPSPPTAADNAASSGEVSVQAEENSVEGEDADDEDSEFERRRKEFVKAEASSDEDSDFEQMRKAGVKIDRCVELENMIDQGDWSAVVAAASRLSKLEVQTDDDSDSSESQSDSLPEARRGWLGISNLLDRKPAMANQSKKAVSTDVAAVDAPDKISLSSRPIMTEQMPTQPPNTADATSQQAPPLAPKSESEKPPPPASSTPNEKETATSQQPPPLAPKSESEQPPPPASSTLNEKETALSDMGSIRANGSNQKQSAMSHSYRKPLSPNVASKSVPPRRLPENDAPTKKAKWSSPKVPSQPAPSDKQDVESPPWTRSGNKQAPQSPPSSPSHNNLEEVKTRRKPTKQEVTAQNPAEPETNDDGVNLVYSYGGAVIETPKSASVASLSSMFSLGSSMPKPRARSTPPTTLRPPQKSWADQPALPGRKEHEEASPPSNRFASKQYTSSGDSNRGQSSQLPGSKRDTGKPSAVRSAQPSWKNPGTSNRQSGPMSSPQPSWAKRDTSLQGKSVSVQNSQSLGSKRSDSHELGNQVTPPPPAWVSRDMSRKELSSIRSLQPTLTKSTPSHDHSSTAMSWINRSTFEEESSPIKSPQVSATTPARTQARSNSFRFAPPSWVNRDASQGEISPMNSPPTIAAPSRGRSLPPSFVEQDISEGELSPMRVHPLASARTDPSNTEAQYFENDKSTSESPPSRTSGSYSSEDSWKVQHRTAESESQREEPVPEVEDVSVSGSFTKEDMSGEFHLQSSTLSPHDFNPSEDNTPPASEQPKRFSTPTKSLAQMAADSVFAIDYELMIAQANQEGNIEDGEASPMSSGIDKSIPQEGELPDEVKAMLDMNRSNVSSLHFDDSRAYEDDLFRAEGSTGVHDKSSSSSNSKEISALSKGSFVPRLSPSKKDIAHSSPRKTRRAPNFSENGPAMLEESREMSTTLSEKVSALDIPVDDNKISSRIEKSVSAMSITLDDSKADESDVGSSAIIGDPESLGAAGGLTEEQAPSIPAMDKGIEGWSLSRAGGEPILTPSFLKSMNSGNESSVNLGTPIGFTIQMSPDSPRRIGPTGARTSDPHPKEMGGKNSLRFGDPMSFGAAGGIYATESAPSVLDRGHAIEEWKGGHVAHPRLSSRLKDAGAPRENAKGAKHVLQHLSPENERQDVMAEATRLENPETWAGRDPEVRIVSRMSRDTIDARKESEEIDALKEWHFSHVPPHDAKKMDPQDPFFQQGDPFGASNISTDALDSNAFYRFAEETSAQHDTFDFQSEKSSVFFSPYGDESPKKKESPHGDESPKKKDTPTKNTGIVARPPRSRAASKAKLKPSRRDRVASMERYDHYYAQQARANHTAETFEI